LKNESPDLTSILTSNKDPEGIQKGVYTTLVSTRQRYFLNYVRYITVHLKSLSVIPATTHHMACSTVAYNTRVVHTNFTKWQIKSREHDPLYTNWLTAHSLAASLAIRHDDVTPCDLSRSRE